MSQATLSPAVRMGRDTPPLPQPHPAVPANGGQSKTGKGVGTDTPRLDCEDADGREHHPRGPFLHSGQCPSLSSHQASPTWGCKQKAGPQRELSYRQDGQVWTERCIQEPKDLGEADKGSTPHPKI